MTWVMVYQRLIGVSGRDGTKYNLPLTISVHFILYSLVSTADGYPLVETHL